MNRQVQAQTFYLLSTGLLILSLMFSCEEDLMKSEPCTVTAAFSIEGELVVENEIRFINESQSAEVYEWKINGTIVSIEWDYTHRFTDIGTYKVSLTTSCGNAELEEKVYTQMAEKDIIIAQKPLPILDSQIEAEISSIDGESVIPTQTKLELVCDPCTGACIFDIEGKSTGVYRAPTDNCRAGYVSLFIKPIIQNRFPRPDSHWFRHGAKIPSVNGTWTIDAVGFGTNIDPAVEGDKFTLTGLITANELTLTNTTDITILGKPFFSVEVIVRKECYDPCLINSDFKITKVGDNQVVNGQSSTVRKIELPIRENIFGGFGGIDFDNCSQIVYVHTLVKGTSEGIWHIQETSFPINENKADLEWNIISQFGTEPPRPDTAKVGDEFQLLAFASPFNREFTELDTIVQGELENIKAQFQAKTSAEILVKIVE